MSSAQDEFNQLINNNREKFSAHPEDRENSDHSSDESSDHDEPQFSDTEDHPAAMHSRNTSSYRVPNTVYDANTGPKGVIADAQAFERARKSSFRRTLLGVAGLDRSHFSSKSVTDDATLLQNSSPPDGSSDDEERFLHQWRTSRMQEMQARSLRKPSPRRKLYGSVEIVDAVGYLDAIEKVTSGTVVVVCVYDPEVWLFLSENNQINCR